MAYDKGNRPEGGFKRRGGGRRRKKVCVFCGKENNEIDYKDTAKLRNTLVHWNSYKICSLLRTISQDLNKKTYMTKL